MRTSPLCLLVVGAQMLYGQAPPLLPGKTVPPPPAKESVPPPPPPAGSPASGEVPSFFGIPTDGTAADKLPAPEDTIKSVGPEAAAAKLAPELEAIRDSVHSGEQVMHDIFDKRMAELRTAFVAETNKAMAQAEAAQKPDVVKFLKRRLSELGADGPMILTYLPGEPVEWHALVKFGRPPLEAWRVQYEQQAAKLSAIFRERLKQAAQGFVEKKQPADAAKAAQMARGLQSWLTLRGRVWASGVQRSLCYGGEGGGHFQHVVKEGGVLVGFQFTEKKYGSSNIIGSLTPVYMASEGQVLGRSFGKPKKGAELKKVMALEGYAVGGIIPTASDRLDGFRVVFMRIQPNEAGLDPKFRYVSDYLGGKGGAPRDACGDDGRLVVGIWGRCGDDMDAVGLILLNKTIPAAPGVR